MVAARFFVLQFTAWVNKIYNLINNEGGEVVKQANRQGTEQ